MSTAAIELHGVSKRYEYFTLEHISFRLEHGQIMGLVGPNGAGKSTTMRILMAIVSHDQGEVKVLGHPIPSEQVEAKWNVGYVSEEMRLIGGATLAWHMRFVRSIYPGWDEAYAKTLLERFGLNPGQRIRGLSRGEHLKALLLLALSRRPRLLILDEPTAGLDPVARTEVIAELADVLRDEDRSILFSSHNTLDVEQICDHITFIDRGRVVASDDRDTFIERWRRIRLEIPPDEQLPEADGVVDVTRSGQIAVVTIDAWEPGIPALLEATGARVREVQHMTLEEIFIANVINARKERHQ